MSIQREYPLAPLVGTAAAIFNEAGEVLLVQRGKPPNEGQWGLPGGLVEVGERLVDAVAREVMEECGLAVEICDLVALFEPIIRDEQGQVRYHYVVVDYWGRYLSGDLRPADDAADARWVAMEGLDELPMYGESRNVVRRARTQWEASGNGKT
ncbi:MAG: NUDIX hydrolase [Caldilineaceae bacterium]|nr:NUDIX hydrolase [Caldilineaceae bacterium]HRJ44507.1 NUDIX hydrolase [Caldilineaceae bacterium]